MNICVVGGAGYVGLITGLCLSQVGHRVVNVDVDQGRIRRLQAGECPVYEEGVESLLRCGLRSGRIRFSTDLQPAAASSEIVFIAVGTPSGEDGHTDISQVVQVVEELAGCLDSYKVLVIKSTVPLATLELLRETLCREKEEGKDFDIVTNPEFLREGKGLHDFFYPDRIVIGASSEKARRALREAYAPIIQGRVAWAGAPGTRSATGPIPVVETSLSSAQMIKYVSNAFLATRVSFINEVAGLCEKVGVDIGEVIRGVGYDPRIGHDYLAPGLGFGGPCLEKDLRALIGVSEANDYQPRLLRSVLERNEVQVGEVITKLKRCIGNPLRGKTVAVFGLTFKAETNDTRNSPALKAIDTLREQEAIVRAYDPVAILECRNEDPLVSYHVDPYEAAHQAHALMILTEWPHFCDLDYARIKANMASACIVDGRNLLDPKLLRALGFKYVGVGRP